jgi:ureidoacrylate peracid hydrolase
MQVEKIDPAKTAMIVVDMQNDFVAAGAAMETPAARAMVPRLAEALKFCRGTGMHVIYTAHVHRRDGSDMGLFVMHPPIAERAALVDGTPGVEIYPDLAPAPGEHVIKKHRYRGFFGTDLDIILREWGVDTVIISGTTTENCCHATARDECSATTGWCSCRMQRQHTIIRTEASGRCRMPTSTTQLWSYSLLRQRMLCRSQS